MVDTLDEFKDKLRSLRKEMYKKGETADVKLVASWLNKLTMALEDLSDSLQMNEAEMDMMCQCCSETESPKKAKKPAKKKKRK